MQEFNIRKPYYDRVHLNYWGYAEGEPAIQVENHDHDYFQVNFTLQGSCEFHTDQGMFLTRKDEMIFIAPGVWHRLVYPEKYLGLCCKFHWSAFGLPPVYYLPAGRLSRGIIQAARHIMEATFPEEFFGNLRGAMIKPEDRYQIVMEQFMTGVMMSLQKDRPWELMPARIAEVRKRLPGAFYSVAEAAAACGLSRNQFCRIVKECTGLTARQFLAEERLKEAAALLKYSNLTIRQIAEKVHFSSQFHFSEFFHRMTGMTPSAYRMKTEKDAQTDSLWTAH